MASCVDQDAALCERERTRRTAPEGSSLRSGWKKRTKDSSKLRVELTRGKTKAKQSKTKRTKTKAGRLLLLLHRRLTISLSSCVGNGVSQETPPSAGGKNTLGFLFLFIYFYFFCQIAFLDCVCISGLSPHFLLHSFRNNSCHQLLFVFLGWVLSVGSFAWSFVTSLSTHLL
jgi:hypothetical protein